MSAITTTSLAKKVYPEDAFDGKKVSNRIAWANTTVQEVHDLSQDIKEYQKDPQFYMRSCTALRVLAPFAGLLCGAAAIGCFVLGLILMCSVLLAPLGVGSMYGGVGCGFGAAYCFKYMWEGPKNQKEMITELIKKQGLLKDDMRYLTAAKGVKTEESREIEQTISKIDEVMKEIEQVALPSYG